MTQMQQIVLKAHPRGKPQIGDFELQTVARPAPAEGEVLLRTLWLSLDPLIRFAIDEVVLTGIARVRVGDVLYGGAVSQVVESRHPDYREGEFVEGRSGWREFAAIDPTQVKLRKIDPAAGSLSLALGVLGMPGQTAHACMIGVGRVAEGECVVISAAAGAVGSTAGQIGKLLGARVVGIAGGAKKCEALKALGFDECVDYRAPNFTEALRAACPDGVNVYVENVGGAVTQAVLPLFKHGARMPVCGFISYYGVGREGPGPDHLPGFLRTIMSKGLEVRGFGGAMVGGQKALDDLSGWVRQGVIRCPETIVDGLQSAPRAFVETFQRNEQVGKVLVKIADPV
jgi:NADPH-dependent curcumin reductase